MSGNSPENRPGQSPSSSRETVPPSTAPVPASRETILPGQADSVAETAQVSGSTVPQEFGRYRLEECLGQGAMGAVYKAHDTQLDRLVALKVPKFDVADSALLERFYREARSAATLNHPNICPVHDVGEIGGIHYISMGYREGKPLSAFVRPDKPLTEKQAVMIIRKLAVALNEAHGKGIIHRDLKPDNVMIDPKSNPVIMDFGLAQRSAGADDIRVTQGGQMLGTPAYMSPEQAEGDVSQMGPRCDIYSLGVILYELLTGRLPYEGSIASVLAQIMKGEPRPPSQFRSDLNPELQALCLKMMAADQGKRHGSMAEVARDLGAFVKGKPKSVRDAAPTATPHGQPAPAPPAGFGAGEAGLSQLIAVDDVPVSARTSRKSRVKKTAVASAPSSKNNPPPWAIWSGAAAGALVILLAGYVLFVRVDKQTVRIEIDDAKAQVFVDGDEVQIKNLGAAIELTPGKHGVEIRRGDIVVKADSFTVLDGDNPILKLEVLKTAPDGIRKPDQPVVSVSQPPDPEKSNGDSPHPVAPAAFSNSTDPVRRAVGWAVSRRFSPHIIKNGGPQPVRKYEDVPDGPIQVGSLIIAKDRPVNGEEWQHLKGLGNLNSLVVRDRRFTDAAIAHLAGSKIKSLHLLDTSISDLGLKTLTAMPALEELVLGTQNSERTAMKITDVGLKTLSSARGLKKVSLRHCNVSAAAVDAFRKALPDCEIETAAAGAIGTTEIPAEFAQSSDSEKRALGFLLSQGAQVQLVYEEGGTFLKSKMVQRFQDVEDGQFRIVRVSVNKDSRIEGDDWSFVTSLPDLGTAHFFPCPGLDDSALAHLAGHPSIGLLQIDIGNLTDAGLAVLQSLPKLNTLHLSRDSNDSSANRINDAALEHLARIPRLRILNISDSDVSDKGLALLSAASLPELRNLYLAGSKVTDQCGVHLGKLSQLTDLTLNNTQVGDGLAPALSNLVELTNLNLSGTNAGDSVLRAIAGHKKLSSLKLSGTRISDAGIVHLRKLPQLQNLTLNSTQVTDDCLASIGQIKSLKKVSLYDCNVTSEAVQQLQSARQGLKIDGTFSSVPLTNLEASTLELSDRMPNAYRNSTDLNVKVLGWLIDRGARATVRLADGNSKPESEFRDAPPEGDFQILAVSVTRNEQIGKEGWSFLRSLPHLQNFNTMGPQFDDKAMAHLTNHPSLQSLGLTGTTVSDEGFQNLSSIRKLTSVRIISVIDEFRGPSVTDTTMAQIAQLPELSMLEMRYCEVTDAGLALLVAARPPLSLLHVAYGKEITDAGLANLDHLKSLNAVNFRGASITDKAVERLATLPALHTLDLSHTQVGDATLKTLSRFPRAKSLYLESTLITDAGLQHLKTSDRWSTLLLSQTAVTDTGVAHLRNLQNLQALHLLSTQVTDDCLATISSLKKLTTVNLNGSKVTLAAAQKLQDERPGLQVLFRGVKRNN